jgi:hypothetical protein
MLKFWMKTPLFEEAGDGNQGGGGGAGAGTSGGFDAAAFQTSLMGEVNKAINGAMKGLKNDFTKMISGQQQQAHGDGTSGQGDSNDGTADTSATKDKPDPRYKALETRFKSLESQLTTERTAREKAEAERRDARRDSVVQGVLRGFNFADDEASQDAFELHRSKLKWSEDGTLVGPDGETAAEDWIKTSMAKKSHLLAPRDVGGAGARNGKAGTGGGRKWTMADLEPATFSKLTPEQQTDLRKYIGQQSGYLPA